MREHSVSLQGWDWTYNKVVPALWKLLESSVADDLFAAVIILIGHLGRYRFTYFLLTSLYPEFAIEWENFTVLMRPILN